MTPSQCVLGLSESRAHTHGAMEWKVSLCYVCAHVLFLLFQLSLFLAAPSGFNLYFLHSGLFSAQPFFRTDYANQILTEINIIECIIVDSPSVTPFCRSSSVVY